MPAPLLHDESHARGRLDERKGKQADNKLANAMRSLPRFVKERWPLKFRKDAELAFYSLLRGSSHVCPACGYDAGPQGKDGRVYACGCDRPNVQALRLYAELVGAVGPQNQLIVTLSQRFGVKSEQELEHIVKRGKSLAELDDAPTETHWQEAMTLLSLCLKEQPSLIPTTRKWLDGLSTATVTESPESAEAAPGTPAGPDLDPEDA